MMNIYRMDVANCMIEMKLKGEAKASDEKGDMTLTS